jgi:hypothetical protein
MSEREIERRDGIVREEGAPGADAPSDRPEGSGSLPHPEDVNETHGDTARDRAESEDEVGPTGATPR